MGTHTLQNITRTEKKKKEQQQITQIMKCKNSKLCVVTKVALSTFELVTGHVQSTGVYIYIKLQKLRKKKECKVPLTFSYKAIESDR